MDFSQFMTQSGIYIAAALYVIGAVIKKMTFVPDWLIPWVLIVLGIVAAGFSMERGFCAQNIIQGIFSAGAAVLTNQTVKQTISREPGDSFLNNVGYNKPQEGIDIKYDEDDKK